MSDRRQKAIEHIKKLLKLANDSAAQGNEAANALGMAQAWMEKYNIDLSDVEASAVSRIEQKATVKDSPLRWERVLSSTVARAFDCQLLFSSGSYPNHRGQWAFIGVDVTPELAGYAFAVLLRQLKRDRAAYVKAKLGRCKPASQRARAVQYCEGWVIAVAGKVQKMAKNERTDVAITAYMNKHHPQIGELKPRNNPKTPNKRVYDDMSQGYQEGKLAQLNHGVGAKSNDAKQLEVF